MTPTLLMSLSAAYVLMLAGLMAFLHGAGCRCPKCGKRYDE